MNADLIVVLDPRRVIVEGLIRALNAGSDRSAVLVAAAAADVSAIPDDTTIVVTSRPGDLPPELRAKVRVCSFSDDVPLTDILAAVRNGEDRLAETVLVPRPTRLVATARTALTEREREIVCRFADGLVSSQIADALGITAKSVDNHKQRIFAKLGVGTLAHAIARSRSSDLVQAAGSVSGERVRWR